MEKAIKDIVKAHQALADQYRHLAQELCSRQDVYGVWEVINANIEEERKARRIERRFAHTQ